MQSTPWVRVGHGVTPAGVQGTYKFISCSTSHVHERLPGSELSLGTPHRHGRQEKLWVKGRIGICIFLYFLHLQPLQLGQSKHLL